MNMTTSLTASRVDSLDLRRTSGESASERAQEQLAPIRLNTSAVWPLTSGYPRGESRNWISHLDR